LFRLRNVGDGADHGLGDGWVTEDLTRQPKAIHDFGGWSHDGTRVAFATNREDQSRVDLYIQKIGEPEAKLIQKGPGGYYIGLGGSPDDRWLPGLRMESNFNQDLYAVEAATGEVRHLTPHKGEVQYHSACWSADGKSVYCASTAEGRDLAGLARIDV